MIGRTAHPVQAEAPAQAGAANPPPGDVARLLATCGLGLFAILLGFGLRLAYALHASPYIDEFTTIWAAQRVLNIGLPQFPSGAIYTQGLIFTYLDAAALVFGNAFSPLLARLPSLALSVATMALTIYAARRLFRTLPVGLAALWLAVDAQAIIWGGRARTYALLQLLVLGAFLVWYYGAIDGDRPALRWLAIGLLVAALIDQPLVLLILPPLAILALVARGWKWLRQPIIWFQAGVMVVALVARWLLYRLMVPAGTTASAEPRAFVDLAHPFASVDNLLPFFTDANRLIPAVLLIGGMLWLFFRAREGALTWRLPVLSMGFILVIVWLEALLVVGVTWRDPRYLYPVLPLLFLGAEAVAVPLLGALAGSRVRQAPRWALPAFTLVLVFWIVLRAWPNSLAAATRDEWGYDRALAIVGQSWQEGDALATIAPAAAFAVLDRADYLAIEEGAQTLVVERDGRRVDGWTDLPLLDSPQRLAEALETHSRLWFVADEMRLERHFSPEFLHLLWARSDLVAFERGTFVFRSRPAVPSPAVDRPLDIGVDGYLNLESYTLSDDRPEPGDTVTVTLYWTTSGFAEGEYTAYVHLVSESGKGVAGHDAPPLGGLYPVARWPRSERSQPFPDQHPLTLPDDLAPGRYRLEVGLYRPDTLESVGERLIIDFLQVGEETIDLPPDAAVARFGDVATLYLLGLGGKFSPGSTAHLDLAWQTGPAGFDDDYTLFLHLLDAQGQIAQQFDAPPARGWYPTSYWHPGEIILDEHALAFSPMLPPGTYRLIAGLYRADGARLPLLDDADWIELDTIELKP
jgi:hypothetical protein